MVYFKTFSKNISPNILVHKSFVSLLYIHFMLINRMSFLKYDNHINPEIWYDMKYEDKGSVMYITAEVFTQQYSSHTF